MAKVEISKATLETALARWSVTPASTPANNFRSVFANTKAKGVDLYGNKFYYFRPSLTTPYTRRILQNNPRVPYSDIEVSPQWHQWLRYTRPFPPSLQEQQEDGLRQQRLKQLARLADERWAQKPSVLDAPRRGNLELGVGDGEAEGTVGRRWEPDQQTKEGELKDKKMSLGEKREKENPWKRERGSPGEGYEPDSWTPSPSRR